MNMLGERKQQIPAFDGSIVGVLQNWSIIRLPS